jgi:hypothetical protein
MVWGSMIALSLVTAITPQVVFSRLPEVIAAYKEGSVITVDNSISVFSELCKADSDLMENIFPILLEHLSKCRAKKIPQHAERIAVCIDGRNRETFIRSLEARANELSESQYSRIAKLKRSLQPE